MHEDLRSRIADYQHGFVRNRSTVSYFLEYTSFILKSIVVDFQVDSIDTNFSKAFDKVRHCLLLDKMSTDIEPTHGCVLTFLGDCVLRDILVS
jgi:hypothetical protein